MISYIKGVLADKETTQVIVDVNGIGYMIDVSPRTVTDLPAIGDTVTLYTYYHQNRDNKITLYGFTSKDGRKVFELALTVSGVGPALAQNIVARLSPSQFQRAVHRGDATTLMRVPRLGQDLAQVIITKLKKNIMKLKLEGDVDLGKPVGAPVAEAIQILVNTLGASELEAEQAVDKAQQILGESAQRENLIAQALRYIRN
ncbi:MAG: Holliday junction ATP-dependent DNA helicase RuvA [Candidatus Poribacteria bacterium]|nr:Holliday junction ATP-dependent DNA helicase RuvA [Candidatus Poribacteria bacterium]